MADDLPGFEGLPVVKASVKITKAGDGLSDALDLDPVTRHVGDEGFYVLRTLCTQVNHRESKAGSEELVRVHTEVVTEIAMVDEADIESMLKSSTERVRLAVEAKEGISRLAFDDDEAALGQAHAAGEHKDGLVAQCPVCEIERAAVAAEEADGQGASISKLGKHRDG